MSFLSFYLITQRAAPKPTLPQGWTLKRFLGKHPSNEPNPDIANPFFRASEIEAWGCSIERIFAACESRSFSVFLVHTKPRRHEGLKENTDRKDANGAGSVSDGKDLAYFITFTTYGT